MGALIQTALNGKERHCINGEGWTAETNMNMLSCILYIK